MRQKKIMAVLLAVLCLALSVMVLNLLVLHRNVNRIPDSAVADLCRVLADEGIYLDEELIPRSREDGEMYVSDASDYEEKTALLLTDSGIRSTFVIPEGQLILHYNGDITEFTGGFGFHYRHASLGERGTISHADGSLQAYEALTEGMHSLSETGEAAQAAMAFLDRQDEQLRLQLQIETVISSVRGEENGRAYVRCLRQIDGVEITENAVICLVEDGVVTEAAGKWCFMTFAQSYPAQLSDITNILFMMKRTLVGTDALAGGCTILGLERC